MIEFTDEQIHDMAHDAAELALLQARSDFEFPDDFPAKVAEMLKANPEQAAQTLFLSVFMAYNIKDAADLEVYFAVYVAVFSALQDYRPAPDAPAAPKPRPAPKPGGRHYGLSRKITDPKNSFEKTGFLKK